VQQAQLQDRDALQGALSGLVEQYFAGSFLAVQTAAAREDWTFTAQDSDRLERFVKSTPLTSYGAMLVTPAGTVAATRKGLPRPSKLPGLSDVLDGHLVAFSVPLGTRGVLVAYADARDWALQGYHRTLTIAPGATPVVVDSVGVVAASGDPAMIGVPLGLPLAKTTTRYDGSYLSSGSAGHGWHAVTVQTAATWSPGITASRHRALIALVALLTLVIALMLVHRHRQQLALRALAEERLYDPLTGLAQRRLFEIRLEAALARARRNDAPVGLLYCDLDGFKAVNDTHGHNVGDKVLRVVAERISATVREDDFAVRLGGDEFAVIVEGVTPYGLELLRSRLYEAIEVPLDSLQPRVSIGGATTRGEQSSDELLHAADLAMYAVKQGRSATITDLTRAHEAARDESHLPAV
jgi:diguanylate cyclase (GGDEF)-like protein